MGGTAKGDKHMGFSVLYQNLKGNQGSAKELADFLKERASAEDDHNKHLNKTVSRVTPHAQAGSTISKAWALIKNSLELIGESQTSLGQSLQDLAKEVVKYGEELHKTQRNIKEQEHGTFDAVNSIQTTTTCLQKAKETYSTRCVELEKLKRENGTAKDITKAESKKTKAREEYKQYLDKYQTVRVNFTEKMEKSSHTFQEEERKYLGRMKTLMSTFAKTYHANHIIISQVCEELGAKLEGLDVDELLGEFVTKKKTGDEPPAALTFQEPDAMPPPVLPPVNPIITTNVTPNEHTNGTPSPPVNLINLSPTSSIDNREGSAATADDASSTTSSSTTATKDQDGHMTASKTKLAKLHFGSWKKERSPISTPATSSNNNDGSNSAEASQSTDKVKRRKEHRASKGMDIVRSPSVTFERGDIQGHTSSRSLPSHSSSHSLRHSLSFSKGFFKKTSKSKKKTSESSLTNVSAAATGQNSLDKISDGGTTPPVDSEGYSIRPTLPETSSKNDSDSDFSSDEDDDRGIKKIKKLVVKPLDTTLPRTNGDNQQLKDAVRGMNLNQTLPAPVKIPPRSKTMDESDPWGPSTAQPAPRMGPLKASLTGDGNHYGLAGSSSSGLPAAPMLPSLTGSFVRARPRANTPTHCFNIEGDGTLRGGSFSRSDSMASLGEDQLNASSSSHLNAPDQIAVAMALTETVHAIFQGTDVTKGKVRVFGSVHVSFPGSAMRRLLSDNPPNPLTFQLNQADKLQALIPNKQVLSADAVSQFGSSSTHSFTFDPKGLAVQLKRLTDQKPGAPYYNLEVLRYEVRGPVAPLLLQCWWKTDSGTTTDLRIDYSLNPQYPINKPLLNLAFTTTVSGGITKVVSQPELQWDGETGKVVWRLTELSQHGDSKGSLKARLTVSKGPSQPLPTNVAFSLADACLSGATLSVEQEEFRLSLLKRKMVSGKYTTEKES